MFRLLIRELCDVLPPQLLKYSFAHKVQIKEKFGEFENVLLSADENLEQKQKATLRGYQAILRQVGKSTNLTMQQF